MKKYLPIIFLALGVLVVVVVFFVLRGRGGEGPVERNETALIEVAPEDRPIVFLTPTNDGHYLTLRVGEINIPGAETMEYELLYEVPGGVTQGVPGMVEIKGMSSFEAELLLGSESSGKFRYDEGVEEGRMTIRFRNRDGKLLIKFISDFHLQTQTQELSSLDGSFTFTRSLKNINNEYSVVMETVGYPGNFSKSISSGPYGIFSSSSQEEPGKVNMDSESVYRWDGDDWTMLEDKKSDDFGIFISAS